MQRHLNSTIKRGSQRNIDFSWGILRPTCDLSRPGDPFTNQEAKAVLFDAPSDKASDPSGFTNAFFKACWGMIKDDIMLAINHFSDLCVHNFHWLNSANNTLVPKTDGN